MVEATPTIPEPTKSPTRKNTKNQIERDHKKLKNKTKQAITVLCKSEDKPFDQLFVGVDSKSADSLATGRLFVSHFGNGDEAD